MRGNERLQKSIATLEKRAVAESELTKCKEAIAQYLVDIEELNQVLRSYGVKAEDRIKILTFGSDDLNSTAREREARVIKAIESDDLKKQLEAI